MHVAKVSLNLVLSGVNIKNSSMKSDVASNELVQAAREYLDLALIHPRTTAQWVIAAGLLILVLAFVLPRVEAAFDARRTSSENGWIMAILSPILLLLTAAAVKVHVLPTVHGSSLQLAALIGGVVVAFLFVIVPICKFLFASEYVSSLIACGITCLCGAVTVFIVHLGFQAFIVGEKAAAKIEERNETFKTP